MPAGGISPPPNVSAAPTGRPRRRKAPRASARRNPRRSRLPLARRKKLQAPLRRRKRVNPNPRTRKSKPNPHPLNPNPRPQSTAVPLPPIGVLVIGADGVAMTRTVPPAGRNILPVNANRGRWVHREGTRRRRLPKKRLLLLLNVRRALRLKNPRKFQRRAFADVTATPDLLRVFRNWR